MTSPASPKALLFGTPADPRLIATVLFGAAPELLLLLPTAAPAVGGVIIPIPGRPGDQGLSGNAAASYTHTQTVASDLWTINHNLGFYPSVSVLTTGGVEIEGGVHHLSPNIVQVDFAGPLAGSARLI